MCEVLLINPPFFRFVGSHNDRLPIGLGYLSKYLSNIGVSNVIYNADATGANTYWPFTRLFEKFHHFKNAIDGDSPLYDEISEKILSYKPKTVVIFGSDPLIPTKDVGNPYIGVQLSKILRACGIRTVAVGPYYTLRPHLFKDDFDMVAIGEPSEKLALAIKNNESNLQQVGTMGTDIVPDFQTLLEPHLVKTDMAMTSLGCLFPCSFCIAGLQSRSLSAKIRHFPMNILMEDLRARTEDKIYLGDLNFTYKTQKQLEEMSFALKENGLKKSFTVETRVDGLKEKTFELYNEIGISAIKVGIESFHPDAQSGFKKKHQLEHTFKMREMARKHGIDFITYVLVGGDIPKESYDYTYKIIQDLDPDNVVTSIWAFNLDTDFRYDTHFSPVALEKAGVDKEVYFKYLKLAKTSNSTVGEILE